MQKYAVIVAGGKGLRMGAALPKQFLLLKGLPILMHTLRAFYDADSTTKIILVLPEDHFDYWWQLCGENRFSVPFTIVAGGASRFQSVLNGLNEIDTDGVVAIHDGVRPLVSKEIIDKSFDVAASKGSAVVAVPCKDSLRVKAGDFTKSVLRSDYYLIQTPQTFRVDAIKKSFAVEELSSFTDDASVYEFSGGRIELIDGDYKNIKITTQEDIIFAEAMISH
ncbi:MAG: 2-C-methyl-D-erythritol 4-phosphate cytidylyltransferase [bacterium]|nr:2-C-methyl-D-erythritol 4-phosphate cytidylyltransferase [bacterium]